METPASTSTTRHGSKRAPVYVGGGQAHPPRPRDWAYRPPQKVRLGALKSALSKFNKEGRLVVVDRFELPEIKTKSVLSALATLKTQKSAPISRCCAGVTLPTHGAEHLSM